MSVVVSELLFYPEFVKLSESLQDFFLIGVVLGELLVLRLVVVLDSELSVSVLVTELLL